MFLGLVAGGILNGLRAALSPHGAAAAAGRHDGGGDESMRWSLARARRDFAARRQQAFPARPAMESSSEQAPSVQSPRR